MWLIQHAWRKMLVWSGWAWARGLPRARAVAQARIEQRRRALAFDNWRAAQEMACRKRTRQTEQTKELHAWRRQRALTQWRRGHAARSLHAKLVSAADAYRNDCALSASFSRWQGHTSWRASWVQQRGAGVAAVQLQRLRSGLKALHAHALDCVLARRRGHQAYRVRLRSYGAPSVRFWRLMTEFYARRRKVLAVLLDAALKREQAEALGVWRRFTLHLRIAGFTPAKFRRDPLRDPVFDADGRAADLP